jgi:SAM-dependent methyltransferase
VAEVIAPCPICGATERRDHAGRPAAVCAGCGALERQRELVRSQDNRLTDGAGRASLEIGPLNSRVFAEYLRDRGWSYRSADRSKSGHPNDPRHVEFVDHEVDLCHLDRFPDSSVDLVIAQHVIEEIVDYRQALDEIRRVLSPGGAALLEIPFDRRRAVSQRQAANHFGNVWQFGADLLVELETRFAGVDAQVLAEGAYRGELLVCGA